MAVRTLVKASVDSAGNETVTGRMAGARPPAYWPRLAPTAPEMKPSHGLGTAVRTLVKLGVDSAGNETATGHMAGTRPPAYRSRLASTASGIKPSHGLGTAAHPLVKVGVDTAPEMKQSRITWPVHDHSPIARD